MRRVGEGRRPPRRQHLLPVGVPLAPERRAPRVVQGVEVFVPLAQPVTERARAGVAVAGDVVAGVLVRDVPHRQRGMVVVARGELGREGEGVLAVERGRGTPRLPVPGQSGWPSWSTGSVSGYAWENHGGGVAVAGGQVDGDPGAGQRSITSSSQPNSYSPLAGSSQAHEKTPRVTKETPARPSARRPRARSPRPLLGVVVAAERQPVLGPRRMPVILWGGRRKSQQKPTRRLDPELGGPFDTPIVQKSLSKQRIQPLTLDDRLRPAS